MSLRLAFLWLVSFAGLTRLAGAAEPVEKVRFNRDIRQLLSDNCFSCHGPDANARKGDLRLDHRDAAIETKAIVPGKSEASPLVERVFSTDPDTIMPPPESSKTLTAAQKELLKRWIAEGAEYEGHWAYIPAVKPAVPAGADAIDHLLKEHLARMGLSLSPAADRRTLARRLSFDLVGLPPSAEEVEAFVSDTSPEAYAKYVERLLVSPHYGERMAIPWLDVVRFADTAGYHSDNPRNIYPYRDWVIRAFNENKPFDQFTVEQLAGDLLPGSTLEQKVASGFNRLLLTTEEGGAQAKDYEARMLGDRVRAVGTVWLGQTLGCSQCHDHKFDPIQARDFYSMGAFFADIQEPIIGRREPGMTVPTSEQQQQLAQLQKVAAEAQQAFDSPHPELAEAFAKWETQQSVAATRAADWLSLKPGKVVSAGKAKLAVKEDNAVLASGPRPDKDTYTVEFPGQQTGLVGLRVEVLPDDSLPAKGPGRAGNGNFVLTEVVARIQKKEGAPQELKFTGALASIEQTIGGEIHPDKRWSATSAIDGDTRGEQFGWAVLPGVGQPQQLVLKLAEPATVGEGETLVVELRQQHGQGNHTLGKFRISATTKPEAVAIPDGPPPPKEIADLLAIPADKRDAGQKDRLFAHFKSVCPELAEARANLDKARQAAIGFEESLPKTLISISMPTPRTVRILPRGDWLNETGEIVSPALPAYLAKAASPDGKRLTRLELAQWVVSKENPLTARVFVNRLWKQFFGVGLSRNTDDLGSQGEWPTHPELLDWLAVEFQESGWDVRHMVRLIVLSDAYRQTSVPTKELLARDPENRQLARQNRPRLEAEMVRDSALAISGLLVRKVGGPSVKPYQPAGYWENLNFPVREYDASLGEDQHRRGLYTWWQRSFVHPSMLAFDAPTREECCADRTRSNIPQQALVLLNDPTYVECAEAFAARILKEGGADVGQKIDWACRQALQRAATPVERTTLTALVEKHRAEYAKDPSAAEKLLTATQLAAPGEVDKGELAAWVNVTRVLLNLHEVITRN